MIQVWRKREDDPFEFDLEFEVVVSDERGETRHHVTLARAAYTRQTDGQVPPETCVEVAFRFLLDREPKNQFCLVSMLTTSRGISPNLSESYEATSLEHSPAKVRHPTAAFRAK